MKIITTDFVEGAKNAEGLTVVIDVFRAFSVACYCAQKNAKKIIAVADIDAALALKEKIPNTFLIGERGGKKLSGFDAGNSPTEILGADISGKTVIHTTHAGTQGLVNARKAQEVLTGALVNARATVAYIQKMQPAVVTLVRMGWQAETRTDEDDACAEYLHRLLLGETPAIPDMLSHLRKSPCTDRFFDERQPWNPASDVDLCLDVDAFDFILKVQSTTLSHVVLSRE